MFLGKSYNDAGFNISHAFQCSSHNISRKSHTASTSCLQMSQTAARQSQDHQLAYGENMEIRKISKIDLKHKHWFDLGTSCADEF